MMSRDTVPMPVRLGVCTARRTRAEEKKRKKKKGGQTRGRRRTGARLSSTSRTRTSMPGIFLAPSAMSTAIFSVHPVAAGAVGGGSGCGRGERGQGSAVGREGVQDGGHHNNRQAHVSTRGAPGAARCWRTGPLEPQADERRGWRRHRKTNSRGRWTHVTRTKKREQGTEGRRRTGAERRKTAPRRRPVAGAAARRPAAGTGCRRGRAGGPAAAPEGGKGGGGGKGRTTGEERRTKKPSRPRAAFSSAAYPSGTRTARESCPWWMRVYVCVCVRVCVCVCGLHVRGAAERKRGGGSGGGLEANCTFSSIAEDANLSAVVVAGVHRTPSRLPEPCRAAAASLAGSLVTLHCRTTLPAVASKVSHVELYYSIKAKGSSRCV